MKSESPTWLTQALSDRGRTHRPANAAVDPGQIRRLDSMDFGAAPSRIVLVESVDRDLAVALVTVLSPEVDMASDADVLVARTESGLSYDLIALPDVSGPAWFVQFGPVLGRIKVGVDDLPTVGISLRDELDARWRWKEDELDAFVALTAECRYQLLDGDTAISVADPAAFDTDLVTDAEWLSAVLETMKLVEAGQIYLPAAVLQNALDVRRSGGNEWRALVENFLPRYHHQLLTEHPSETAPTDHWRAIDTDQLPAALESMVERLNDKRVRCVHVATVSSMMCEDRSPGGRVRELILAGKRHQVVFWNVDKQGAQSA